MHYIYYKIFKFNFNDITGYQELANHKRWVNCLNSTSCIQTENQYIQCIIPGKVENGIDNFKIGIYIEDRGREFDICFCGCMSILSPLTSYLSLPIFRV